jgi:predicted dehydrogenase
VVLQVGHNKRRQTANRRLAELVHGGDLGDLQYIETHISVPVAFKPSVPEWRQQAEQLPAGGMTPLGVHMVDAIGDLGGAVTEVFTMSRRVYGRYDVDDVTSVVLGLEAGPLASLVTLMAVGPVTTIGVYGTEASAWSEGDGDRLYIQPRGAAERSEEEVETIDTVADELEEFAACIRTGDKPETGAPEGVAVAAILEAIVESAENNAPVRVR